MDYLNRTLGDNDMELEKLEKTIKSIVLDSLVSQSANVLTPEVISKISLEIMERVKEVLREDNVLE